MQIQTLTKSNYDYITNRVYDYARLNLTENKKSLVVSRLSKRIKEVGLHSINNYVEFLQAKDKDNKEFKEMVDVLTTNYTLFFREINHFNYIQNVILPKKENEILNVWSAASSTGQEIYSILMTIKEYERESGNKVSCNLFASDISNNVLSTASKGVYQNEEIDKIDKTLLKRYFLEGTGDSEGLVKIKNEYINKIKFFRQNLNDERYHVPQMDVIFLRNVLIYFDNKTKMEIASKLHSYLKPGGYLIIGHSEYLSGIENPFKHIGQSIYQKKES